MLTKLIVPNFSSNKLVKFDGKIMNLRLGYTTYKYSELFPLDVIEQMGKLPNDTVNVSVNKSKFHLRWMYAGWPCIIEMAAMTKGGNVGWRVAFNGGGANLTNCYSGTLVGDIPESVNSLTACNIPNYTSNQASLLFNTTGDYSEVPPLENDTDNWDQVLNDVLYFDDLPIFRTWHLGHELLGAKYSTDPLAFKELDLDSDDNSVTYELQMNDALSYGEDTYDDAAFVFYKLGR